MHMSQWGLNILIHSFFLFLKTLDYYLDAWYRTPNLIKIRSSIRSSFFLATSCSDKKKEERIEDLILIRL